MEDSEEDDGPFTTRVKELRRRNYRYADLEQGCDRVRSTAWFNNLINNGSRSLTPPAGSRMLRGFARLFSITPRDVACLIADEWYGVRASEQSARVRGLAPRIDQLSTEDAELLEAVVHRLQPTSS